VAAAATAASSVSAFIIVGAMINRTMALPRPMVTASTNECANAKPAARNLCSPHRRATYAAHPDCTHPVVVANRQNHTDVSSVAAI
jgi:hypothetical protein